MNRLIKNKNTIKSYMGLESMSKKINFPDCSYFEKGSNIYVFINK